MDMIKGLNKRGQEGLTLTTLLLIVLGVVVVVVIILGATGAFDFIFGKVDVLPGQSLETAVKSCQTSAGLNLKADFCSELKQVDLDGATQYVTCTYLMSQKKLFTEQPTDGCEGNTVNYKDYCNNKKLSNSTMLDGKTCKDIFENK